MITLCRRFRRSSLRRPYLLLLSEFLDPAPFNSFLSGVDAETWTHILGVDSWYAIGYFLAEGLIQREAAPEGAAARGETLVCTPAGARLVARFRAAEARHRTATHLRCLRRLSRRRFHRAARMAATYKAEDVFITQVRPNGQGYDPTADVGVLKDLWAAPDRFYRTVAPEAAALLTRAAALWYLFGLTSVDQIATPEAAAPYHRLPEAAVRQLLRYGQGKRDLREWKALGITERVTILAGHDACPACRQVAGRTFAIDEAPELPLAGCTHEAGCRCVYAPAEQEG